MSPMSRCVPWIPLLTLCLCLGLWGCAAAYVQIQVQVVDVPTSQWSQLTPKTASLIRANPNANYFVPDFDGEVIFMVPGVTSANAQSKVKLVSFAKLGQVIEIVRVAAPCSG